MSLINAQWLRFANMDDRQRWHNKLMGLPTTYDMIGTKLRIIEHKIMGDKYSCIDWENNILYVGNFNRFIFQWMGVTDESVKICCDFVLANVAKSVEMKVAHYVTNYSTYERRLHLAKMVGYAEKP